MIIEAFIYSRCYKMLLVMKYKAKIEVECDSKIEIEAVLDIDTNLKKIKKITNYLFLEEEQLQRDTKESIIQKIKEIVKPKFNY